MVAVTVAVVRPIRLCRVEFGSGHQIVVGGRLVSETREGKTTPMRDLPAYTDDDFPADVEKFVYEEDRSVSVLLMDEFGVMKELKPVRACSILFHPVDADSVREWISRRAGQ